MGKEGREGEGEGKNRRNAGATAGAGSARAAPRDRQKAGGAVWCAFCPPGCRFPASRRASDEPFTAEGFPGGSNDFKFARRARDPSAGFFSTVIVMMMIVCREKSFERGLISKIGEILCW